MVRPNVASTFPRHVFLRSPNFQGNLRDRVGDRDSCFKATLLHLTERFNGKDVYLVGTMNQSTMLAQRTKKLIEELKPDTVLVQSSAEWWSAAEQLKYVDSQEEMSQYDNRLQRYLTAGDKGYMWWPGRSWLQMFRLGMYSSLFNHFFKLQFRYDLPGLEVKYACEAAQAVGARVEFMGAEIDDRTSQRLAHETRMNLFDYYVKRFQWRDSIWVKERNNNAMKQDLVGPAAFTEKCMDQYLMNWYTGAAATFFPQFKRIFVDIKDEDLFE